MSIVDNMEVPSYSLLTLATIGIFTYLVAGVIYRLYFHPLSKFPGPKLAAVTHLYEFYFNIIRDGMFIWEIERMHQQYGSGFSLHDQGWSFLGLIAC